MLLINIRLNPSLSLNCLNLTQKGTSSKRINCNLLSELQLKFLLRSLLHLSLGLVGWLLSGDLNVMEEAIGHADFVGGFGWPEALGLGDSAGVGFVGLDVAGLLLAAQLFHLVKQLRVCQFLLLLYLLISLPSFPLRPELRKTVITLTHRLV